MTLLKHETCWDETDTDCNQVSMEQTNKIHGFIFHGPIFLLTYHCDNPIKSKIRIFSMTSLKIYVYPKQ